MTAIQLIEKYFDAHAGKSSHIDSQLRLVQQAVKDAVRCLDNNEFEFAISNLAIARSLVTALIEVITPFHSTLRDSLITIYHSCDNELCDIVDKKKAPNP